MCILGVVEHYVGDQMSARRYLEQALAQDPASDHGRDASHFQDVVRFGTDLRVSTQVFLARVQWWQGFSEQAVRTAETSIEEAQATGHALSLCYALALAACPIALWVGNLTAAAHYTGMLIDNSIKHDLPRWSAYGSRFQKAVVLMGGDIVTGSQLLDTSLDEVAQSNLSFPSFTGLGHLVEILIHAGRMAEGLAVLKGMEQYEAGCYTPEVLRLKGELSLLHDTIAAVEAAKDLFRRALDEAHRQGALSWELRAAASLARLLRKQGHSDDAVAVLQPVYNRFTEGFGTADLVAAKQILEELGTSDRD
jgi:predicted ATPase